MASPTVPSSRPAQVLPKPPREGLCTVLSCSDGTATCGRRFENGFARPPPGPRRTPDHPPYSEMIQVALRSQADDGGSTLDAISRRIAAVYLDLPWAHELLLPHYIGRLIAVGEIVVTASGRYALLSPSSSPSPAPARGAEPGRKPPVGQNEQTFKENRLSGATSRSSTHSLESGPMKLGESRNRLKSRRRGRPSNCVHLSDFNGSREPDQLEPDGETGLRRALGDVTSSAGEAAAARSGGGAVRSLKVVFRLPRKPDCNLAKKSAIPVLSSFVEQAAIPVPKRPRTSLNRKPTKIDATLSDGTLSSHPLEKCSEQIVYALPASVQHNSHASTVKTRPKIDGWIQVLLAVKPKPSYARQGKEGKSEQCQHESEIVQPSSQFRADDLRLTRSCGDMAQKDACLGTTTIRQSNAAGILPVTVEDHRAQMDNCMLPVSALRLDSTGSLQAGVEHRSHTNDCDGSMPNGHARVQQTAPTGHSVEVGGHVEGPIADALTPAGSLEIISENVEGIGGLIQLPVAGLSEKEVCFQGEDSNGLHAGLSEWTKSDTHVQPLVDKNSDSRCRDKWSTQQFPGEHFKREDEFRAEEMQREIDNRPRVEGYMPEPPVEQLVHKPEDEQEKLQSDFRVLKDVNGNHDLESAVGSSLKEPSTVCSSLMHPSQEESHDKFPNQVLSVGQRSPEDRLQCNSSNALGVDYQGLQREHTKLGANVLGTAKGHTRNAEDFAQASPEKGLSCGSPLQEQELEKRVDDGQFATFIPVKPIPAEYYLLRKGSADSLASENPLLPPQEQCKPGNDIQMDDSSVAHAQGLAFQLPLETSVTCSSTEIKVSEDNAPTRKFVDDPSSKLSEPEEHLQKKETNVLHNDDSFHGSATKQSKACDRTPPKEEHQLPLKEN